MGIAKSILGFGSTEQQEPYVPEELWASVSSFIESLGDIHAFTSTCRCDFNDDNYWISMCQLVLYK
jgi:hypothetical protein